MPELALAPTPLHSRRVCTALQSATSRKNLAKGREVYAKIRSQKNSGEYLPPRYLLANLTEPSPGHLVSHVFIMGAPFEGHFFRLKENLEESDAIAFNTDDEDMAWEFALLTSGHLPTVKIPGHQDHFYLVIVPANR